jgi:small subunit ribosomal protein S27e
MTELIPKTKSLFLRVKCPQCSNEQTIYSNPSTKVKCIVCESIIIEPRAGRGLLKGKIIKKLE